MAEQNRYKTPAAGAVDWHVPLNENFQQLNDDIEIRDLDANRSLYEPIEGRKFFATDASAIYLGDGTAWRLWADLSAAGSSGGLERHLSEGRVVAVGRNVCETFSPDSTTTPVQDAIDAIGVGNGGTIWLPPGTTPNDGPLMRGEKKSIIGCGMFESRVEITDLSANGLQQDPNLTRDWRYSYLDGFSLHGSDRQARTGGSAIYLNENPVQSFNMGRMNFSNWNDPVIHQDGAHAFESDWGHLYFSQYQGRAFYVRDAGEPLEIKSMIVGPEVESPDIADGAAVHFHNPGGQIILRKIAHRNNKLANSSLYIQADLNSSFRCDFMQYESQAKRKIRIAHAQGRGIVRFGYMRSGDEVLDYALRIGYQSQFDSYGPINRGISVRNNFVEVVKEPNNTVWYWGPSSDIDVNYGGGAKKVYCFGDMRFADA